MIEHEGLLTKPAKAEIDRFLTYVSKQPPSSVEDILSKSNDKLCYEIHILSTNQSTSLIEFLILRLEESIQGLENNKINISKMQGVCWMLCTLLNNCRLLGPSVSQPASLASQKIILRVKELLSSLGVVILSQTHMREVMQMFLRLCHVWGDMNALSRPSGDTLDTSPEPAPDLSHIFPFLSSHQWSVITERIANFGNQLCNRLLIKLLIQRLEYSMHWSEHGQSNCKQITKCLVERCNSSASVASVMNPEEFSIVLRCLSRKTLVQSLISHLFNRILQEDDEVVKQWIKNEILLENKQFIEAVFEVAFKSLLETSEANVASEHMELHAALKSISLHRPVDTTAISHLINNSLTSSSLESRGDLGRKVCNAVINLPYGHLATFGHNALLLASGTMVCLGLVDSLMPIFERLLLLTEDPSACFDVGLMIRWVSRHVTDHSTRSEIIQLLVKKGTINSTGLVQFKRLVKSLKRSSVDSAELLETQVNLHVSIRKCWKDKKDPVSLEYNAVLAKQRKRLCKQVRSALSSVVQQENNSHTDWVLFDAFTIDLQQRQREQPTNMKQLIDLNFNEYLEKALMCLKSSKEESALKSSINFVTTVLNCASLLRPVVKNKNHLVVHIYHELEGSNCPDILWEHIGRVATTQEMTQIMSNILKNVMSCLMSADPLDFTKPPNTNVRWSFVDEYQRHEAKRAWSNHYVNVWRLFIQKADGDKLKCCCDPIKKLISHPEYNIPVTDNVLDGSLLTWLRFMNFIATHPKIPRSTQLEKYLINVLLSTPIVLPHETYFQLHINIMTVFVSQKHSPAVRYPHFVFLIFKKLLNWILREGEESESVHSAFLLEKLVGLIIRRKELRLFFFLQEIICVFVTKEISTAVKMHLKNCAFAMLGVIDEKSSLSLQASLPQACREVFRNIHSEFSKFYRYKGKI